MPTYIANNYYTGQIHTWGGSGSDTQNLGFDVITKVSAGHHVRTRDGNDFINFQNLSNVRNTVVGRIEDFDNSRDKIQVNGNTLNLSDLPSYARIVEWNGDHNDAGAKPQQYLLINSGTASNPGHIFYSLEGARVDMDGNGDANSGDQERHFTRDLPSNFNNLATVSYVDQVNIVPTGYSPGGGGVVINDIDEDAGDVNAWINGTGNNDLIAAGINDDKVNAGSGNDRVWGGSGDDFLRGGNGNDTIKGGTGDDELRGDGGHDQLWGEQGNDLIRGYDGNDKIYGGDGNDKLYGYSGNDKLYGGNNNDVMNGHSGNDSVYGQNGNDRMYGSSGNDYMSGGNGNDKIYGGSDSDRVYGGSGNDLLQGQSGQDFARGDSGADKFVFKTGDLVNWSNTTGANSAERSLDLDLVEDFVLGQDKIVFSSYSGVDDMSDLRCWKTTIDGDVHFTVKVHATNDRILVNVADNTQWSDFFNTSNFDFT